MSTRSEKLDKQFTYQQTVYATTNDPAELFVSVDRLTVLLASQTRAEPDRVRRWVKDELERRADAGELRRWLEVHGPSHRADRVDHYLLPAA